MKRYNLYNYSKHYKSNTPINTTRIENERFKKKNMKRQLQ